MKRTLILCLLGTALFAAQAQTVWRCGPDGREYSASPCRDGRQVAVADERTNGERIAAQGVVQREREALVRLAGERREREQDAIRRGLGPAAIEPLAKRAEAEPAPASNQGKGKRPRKKSPRNQSTKGAIKAT